MYERDLHYPLERPWLLRWLPPQCSCRVARYHRCPDRPGATDPDPMPAVWAYVSLAIAIVTAVGLWLGTMWAWGWIR